MKMEMVSGDVCLKSKKVKWYFLKEASVAIFGESWRSE